ncbi:unnamed protein product [marine sediment metagenome]|uniref:Uncharacterized protein n=1 Tax=marine sediment metagenome TaxID=412755 RepID=X1GHJ2_9ZZZZ
MTQELTQKRVIESPQTDCDEVDAECLEMPVFENKPVLKPAVAGGKKTGGRGLGKISRFLAKRSATARFVRKSKYNHRYHQEQIPIERVKRRVPAHTPPVY